MKNCKKSHVHHHDVTMMCSMHKKYRWNMNVIHMDTQYSGAVQAQTMQATLAKA